MRVELNSVEVDNAGRNLVVKYDVHGERGGGEYWLQPSFGPEDADPSVYEQDRYITGDVIQYGIDTVEVTFDIVSANDGDAVYIDAILGSVNVPLDEFDKTNPSRDSWSFQDQLISDITIDLPELDESKVSMDGCVSAADSAEVGDSGYVEVDIVNENNVSLTAVVDVFADGTKIGESFATQMEANEEVTIEIDVEYPSSAGTYDLTAEFQDIR